MKSSKILASIPHVDIGKNSNVRSKIFNHFIKGKKTLSPMETIVAAISRELESLKNLVKLARKKKMKG